MAKKKTEEAKVEQLQEVPQQPIENAEIKTEAVVSVEPKAEAKPKKKVTKKKVSVEQKSETKIIENYRQNIKLFNRYPLNVEVKDIGLAPYINLTPVYVPYSAGRTIKKQFWKSKKSIIERLAAKLMVPGHKGKKHFFTSRSLTGKIATHYVLILKTLKLIEEKTKKNPLEVLVRAIEASAPREGVATIEYGGVRYPKAADIAPQRRIDLALRWLVQGAFVSSRKNKNKMHIALAEEIIAAANKDPKANAIAKKTELERQAGASR